MLSADIMNKKTKVLHVKGNFYVIGMYFFLDALVSARYWDMDINVICAYSSNKQVLRAIYSWGITSKAERQPRLLFVCLFVFNGRHYENNKLESPMLLFPETTREK
jgi:hypothetical protein